MKQISLPEAGGSFTMKSLTISLTIVGVHCGFISFSTASSTASGATVHSRAFVWETPQECEVPKITALGGTLGYFGYSQGLPTPRELPYTLKFPVGHVLR
jgi:hypothetical protein